MSSAEGTSITDCVVAHGARAVIEYRRMCGTDLENRVPEVFLGGSIARGLHHDLGLNAHVERYYTTIAVELGKQVGVELTDSIGDLRADVAIYRGGRPSAVVEVKKYDEAGSGALIKRDLTKMRLLAAETDLEVYLAVLVAQTRRIELPARVEHLEDLLGGRFQSVGPPQLADGGRADWSWTFACGVFM